MSLARRMACDASLSRTQECSRIFLARDFLRSGLRASMLYFASVLLFSTPSDPAELFLQDRNGAASKITDLDRLVLFGKNLAPVESFSVASSDHRWDIQAFLTNPHPESAAAKVPLVVNIHGGPHEQRGPSFYFLQSSAVKRQGRNS